MNITTPYGWSGTLSNFLDLSNASFIQKLNNHLQNCMNINPDQNQISAWVNCYDFLQKYIPNLIQHNPEAKDWTIIFEYELPRERGRRPDVVILAGSQIFVIEYKVLTRSNRAFIDQVSAYARDLEHYHAASHGRDVFPILNRTRAFSLHDRDGEVFIISPDNLPNLFSDLYFSGVDDPIDPATWLNSDYAPYLP